MRRSSHVQRATPPVAENPCHKRLLVVLSRPLFFSHIRPGVPPELELSLLMAMPRFISLSSPLSQVRALALLQVADAVRRAPSSVRPGESSGPPSDAPACFRPFSWNALFPPAEDGFVLPSGGELNRFAAALKSIAQDAAKCASSAGSAPLAPTGPPLAP